MRSLEERRADRAARRATAPEYAEKPISEELQAKAAEVDEKLKAQVELKAAKQQTVSEPAQIVKEITENAGDKPLW